MKPVLNLGLIGSGFMGKAHVFGFATAARVFDMPAKIVFHTLADATPQMAQQANESFGFENTTGNWRDLIDNPEIDIIDITAPNAFHFDMAVAAIAAGKHVYCEKPLAPTYEQALQMRDLANAAGIKTQVGFNYLMNPMMTLARDIIASGQLGEITSYRGIHAEDYMSDPLSPVTFRHDIKGGGALADIGSHALATAKFLLGPMHKVMGDCRTVIKQRPDKDGVMQPIAVDDITRALIIFKSGVSGSIEANWLATGRSMQHDFEVYGSKGSLAFTQERFNELNLFLSDDPSGQRGYRRIEAGPDHEPYGRFCIAPGHQLGFNDLKAIEVNGFVEAIINDKPEPYNFAAGARIQQIIEAIQGSSFTGHWFEV